MRILDKNADEIISLNVELSQLRNELEKYKNLSDDLIDSTLKWIAVHGHEYIIRGGISKPYISGAMLTDLRHHMNECYKSILNENT